MTAITKTNGWLNLTRNVQSGAASSGKITYVALGTGNSTPLAGQTQLDNEVFRKAVTSYTNGATGEIFVNAYIAPGEAVGVVIAEVGFFSGSASSLANSGTMIARALYSHTKTNLESIQFQLDATTS